MKILFSILLLISYLIGCGATYQTDTVPTEQKRKKKSDKIKAEAYLFDAKLKQHGKPTSVRLFFYQTDSIIAIGGKGYLGKGALKGWMTNDSILVTFPTLKEYLYESVDDLFASFNCSGEIPKFNLMTLFTTLPDETYEFAFAEVTILKADAKRPKYKISFPNCKWKLIITYDKRPKGYRIRNFSFRDGEGTTLTGKRREYKGNSKVPFKHFETEISPTMYRIIP